MAGGGAEHQMQILCTMLVEKGYDVTLVTYADVEDHYTPCSKIHRIKLGVGKNALVKTICIFFYFIGVKTDCVISFRHACNARVLLPLLFRPSKVKVICGERNLSQNKVDFYQKILFNFLYKRANYIVANSYSQTRYIENSKPQYIPKLRTIINYTDLNNYRSTPIPSSMNQIRIGIFSRYSKQKNPYLFADMIKELYKEFQNFIVEWHGSDVDAHGNYNQDYLEYREYVEKLGLSDILKVEGSVKNPYEYMDKYHVIALPSKYEGFSNSISEAICCGKPMIVSDVSDNHLMVHNGINGFLHKPKDLISMKEAYAKFLCLSYEEMVKMGEESRKIAEDLFNKSEFINSYIELIER